MPLPGEIVAAKPLLVIVGPTAIGKTATAIRVAQELEGEIIGADSRQIYQQMDIGTAKPSAEELAAVPHHLIDIIPPDAVFTAKDFKIAATSLIQQIHQRHCLPIIVGGTGQYVTALTQGWQFPEVPPNPALRQELEHYAEQHGWQALLERLRQLDPVTAERIDGQNIRRVVRAIEVCIDSGQSYSELRRKQPPDYNVLEFVLTIDDRLKLYERADKRIQHMLETGLLDEVRALQKAGYTWNLPAMSSLGYGEIGAHLRGEVSLEEAITELKRSTRRFIRRQYTWFRKHNANAIWLESNTQTAKKIIEHTQKWLRNLAGE
jgi:tRNA dimethylallyltransferase